MLILSDQIITRHTKHHLAAYQCAPAHQLQSTDISLGFRLTVRACDKV